MYFCTTDTSPCMAKNETVEEMMAGGVYLRFTFPPQYHLGWCSSTSHTEFPTDLPAESDKIWTITLSKTSVIRLIIDCNNKEVLNVVLSNTTCSNGQWSDYWTKDVEQIYFPSPHDSASDYYRPGKSDTCILYS